MNKLYLLLNSLSVKEQKQFKKHLTHKSNMEKRKDVEVFNKICKLGDYNVKFVVTELYGRYNRATSTAHRMLRARVKRSLEDFIHQQVRKDDTPLYIHKLITIARFLYFRKKYALSWNYLLKAEKIAIKAEEYELLDQVYRFMIEYVWTQEQDILPEIIQKDKENQEQAQASRSINLALSVIHNQIQKLHSSGKSPDIEKIVQGALRKFDIQKVIRQKASQFYKLAMVVKVSLEEKKDYEELYKYMKSTLQKMEQANLFNKYNYHYRIELLNIICYSAAGAGNYSNSEKYIHIIEKENKKHPETDLLSIRGFMAKVAYLCLTNRIHEAIEVLEYLEGKYKKLYHEDDHFFMALNYNMATAHLHMGNVKTSIKYVHEVLKNSKRILLSFGLGDLFFCHATECLLFIESGEMEYANYRLKNIARQFKELLEQEHGKRKAAFVKILRHILGNGNAWKEPSFRQEAWEFINMQPIYKPGLEFISFNAWLYSKLENVPYSEGKYNKAIEKRIKNMRLSGK